ncbi:recombinase family protein [Kribbella sp. DT2]|uniref:recombinase family protein n=1 Tax=Kribbella sp. DT2 TaxID=3393427 RepID=UPI003CF5A19B
MGSASACSSTRSASSSPRTRVSGRSAKVARMPLTASILGRLSKASDEENLSLQGWLDRCRELAARLGAIVVGEHIDDGVSGALKDREGLRAWLADGATGRADILIAPHTDRITRDGLETAVRVLELVEGNAEGQPKPVRVMTLNGLDSDNDNAFRLQFVIEAELARAELNRIKARAKERRVNLAKAGRYPGGVVPFGTKVVLVEDEQGRRVKVLAAREDEIPLTREAARRALAGTSLRTLAREFNSRTVPYVAAAGEQHAPRPHGKSGTWGATNLMETLLSDASAKFALDTATVRQLILKFAPEVDAVGKPIPKAKRGGGRPTERFLRGGALICGGCGRPLECDEKRYKCRSFHEGFPCDAPVSIHAKMVEPFLTDEILTAFGDVPYLERVTSVAGADQLEAAIQAEEAAQAALLAGPDGDTLAAFQAAQEARRTLEAAPEELITKVVASGRTIRSTWEAGDADQRNTIVRQALRGPAVIRPSVKADRKRATIAERVEFEWAIGDYSGWPA